MDSICLACMARCSMTIDDGQFVPVKEALDPQGLSGLLDDGGAEFLLVCMCVSLVRDRC